VTAIVVHGGAGQLEPARHDRLRAGVRTAAEAGDALLAAGGSALDAVVAAVRVLEDDDEFNAGRGAVLTREGTVETDASVMCGDTRRVGAVAAVPDLGRAVALARAVLDAGEHAILAGPQAWQFAAEVGISPAAPGALVTERQLARWRAELAKRSADRDGGTVGAVARDANGRLAAATSTGGIAYKRAGRVGDSPIPCAGTWADAIAAISATGDGEAILRVALARGVAARVAAGLELRAAARDALAELAKVTAGSAGLIAVTQSDSIAIQLSPTMPTAWIVREPAGITRSDGLGECVT
jgi:beta-aspartyl-peptidase (threonine type)